MSTILVFATAALAGVGTAVAVALGHSVVVRRDVADYAAVRADSLVDPSVMVLPEVDQDAEAWMLFASTGSLAVDPGRSLAA